MVVHLVPKLGMSGEILEWFWTVPKLTVDCMCCLYVDMLLLCLNNMCFWYDSLGSSKIDCTFIY